MDWGHAYRSHLADMTAELSAARRRGATAYRVAGRTVDPSRLSNGKIDDLARLDAEQTVNEAIIRHNEEIGRRRAA